MGVKVMLQVAGEILGSDILRQIGNAKSWIKCGIFREVVWKNNRHVGVVRQFNKRHVLAQGHRLRAWRDGADRACPGDAMSATVLVALRRPSLTGRVLSWRPLIRRA